MLVNLAFTLTGGTVINPYMAQEMGFGREMLALPFAVYMIMTGLPAPLAAARV
jgi:hypothetical protein